MNSSWQYMGKSKMWSIVEEKKNTKTLQFRGPKSAMSLSSICDVTFDMSSCVVSKISCNARKDIIKKRQFEMSAKWFAS